MFEGGTYFYISVPSKFLLLSSPNPSFPSFFAQSSRFMVWVTLCPVVRGGEGSPVQWDGGGSAEWDG